MTENLWPPKDGRAYVHSEAFGELVVHELNRLSKTHPRLDLADAAAIVFHWFNSKLNANRNFISRKRFPTVSGFRAYVRQMLYNAGMYAIRLRSKNQDLTEVPESEAVVDSPSASLQAKKELLKLVDLLEEPHKSIFTRFFLDEEELYLIATALDITEDNAHTIYEEAVDRIRGAARKSLQN